MFKVRYISIRDSRPCGESQEQFPTVKESQKWTPRELRHVSSVWRVEIFCVDTDRIASKGVRSGRNGTGAKWEWKNV